MRQFFMFDPEYTNMNHGSFGALPRPVWEAQVATAHAPTRLNSQFLFLFSPVFAAANILGTEISAPLSPRPKRDPMHGFEGATRPILRERVTN